MFYRVLFDGAHGYRAGDIISADRLANAKVPYLLKVGAIEEVEASEELVHQEVSIETLNAELIDLRSQVVELQKDKTALNDDLTKANAKIAELEKAAKAAK